MSKWLILLLLIFSAGVNAQTAPSATPTPQPTPNQDVERQRQMMERREMDNAFGRLDAVRRSTARARPIPRAVLLNIKDIYRNATTDEKASLQPEKQDLNDLKDFLRQKDTGIVRLVDNSDCGSSAYVISADPKCLKYTMPGSGSLFSFRKGDYSIDRVADIRFRDGGFEVAGVMQHGILTGLGDIEIDKVSISTPGMKFLTDFVPSRDIGSAREAGRELQAGIDRGGFYYRQELNAVEKMTYALRAVAYQGTVLRSFNGVVYDELDFDKRLDIIVAFRVIRLHDDGSVTIAWKRLAKKSSPTLKRGDTPDGTVNDNRFVARKRPGAESDQ